MATKKILGIRLTMKRGGDGKVEWKGKHRVYIFPCGKEGTRFDWASHHLTVKCVSKIRKNCRKLHLPLRIKKRVSQNKLAFLFVLCWVF
jgi:hypothetical protein